MGVHDRLQIRPAPEDLAMKRKFRRRGVQPDLAAVRLDAHNVGRLQLALVHAGRRDPDAPVGIQDRQVASRGGRHLIAVDAPHRFHEFITGVQPAGLHGRHDIRPRRPSQSRRPRPSGRPRESGVGFARCRFRAGRGRRCPGRAFVSLGPPLPHEALLPPRRSPPPEPATAARLFPQRADGLRLRWNTPRRLDWPTIASASSTYTCI